MNVGVANNGPTTPMVGGITGKGFKPGKSGNPRGRPKDEIGEEIRKRPKIAKEIVEYLLSVMRDPKQSTQNSLTAVKELMDRGWGKATQSIESETLDKFFDALNARRYE